MNITEFVSICPYFLRIICYMFKSHSQSSFFIWLAFITVMVSWGFNWIVMKLAIQHIPAFWFTVFRLLIGIVVVFIVQLYLGKFQLPKKRDLPLILSVGWLQIGIYFCLSTEALHYVGVGRSAILAYTTPLWVTPLAVWLFHEAFNRMKLIGLILGICGILVLFNPLTFPWHDKYALFGNAILLLASLCAAIALLHVRYGKWHCSAVSLFLWQLIAALVPALLFAEYFEPLEKIVWNWQLALELLYSSLISLVFCYWVMLWITRTLPAATTALGTLAVPIFGMIFSSLFLSEVITLNLISATALIMAGLICVVLGSRKVKKI